MSLSAPSTRPQTDQGDPGPSRRPFNVSQAVNNISSTANNLASLGSSNGSHLRHRHAHHLHSIPPREKSTRTLIIDHMLWVHARTRFAQARAELGLTDRTGGPSSLNYAHRRRPENYDEDDEEASEGEEYYALLAREGGPGHPHNDDEDLRIARQDLPLARDLRARSEGLEKVIVSLLEQPPPVHPILDDEYSESTTQRSVSGSTSHPHKLPNGVRLRLALATIVNDFFARHTPPAPYRDHRGSESGRRQHQQQQQQQSPEEEAHERSIRDGIPPALLPLASISAWPLRPNNNIVTTPSQSSASPASSHASPGATTTIRVRYPAPNSRVRAFYSAGADPSTANSPPSLRCSRHLHTGCEICLLPNANPPIINTAGRARTGSSGNLTGTINDPRHPSHPSQNHGASSSSSSSGVAVVGGAGGASSSPSAKLGGAVGGWQEGAGVGSGLERPGVAGNLLRRRCWSRSRSPRGNQRHRKQDTALGAGSTKLAELIPRFLKLSALVATELANEYRERLENELQQQQQLSGEGENRDSRTSPERQPPRAQWREWSVTRGQDQQQQQSRSPERFRTPTSPLIDPVTSSNNNGGSKTTALSTSAAFRPTREWYMLLAGLLTRAVLESYLTENFTGLEPIECLLSVGLDIQEILDEPPLSEGDEDANEQDDPSVPASWRQMEREYSEFDPDGLPSLKDAARILFPSSRPYGQIYGRRARYGRPDDAVAPQLEFEAEMVERLERFYNIPERTPDIATHMEDMAWQYPAENVERAAVRFCEAVAKWRGKPELETYKKKNPSPASQDVPATPGGSTMTIDSIVHSNPASPIAHHGQQQHHQNRRKRGSRKPSISTYFAPESGSGSSSGAAPPSPWSGSATAINSINNSNNVTVANTPSSTNANNNKRRMSISAAAAAAGGDPRTTGMGAYKRVQLASSSLPPPQPPTSAALSGLPTHQSPHHHHHHHHHHPPPPPPQ